MFFSASARLDKTLPVLSRLVESCDRLIAGASRDTPLTADAVASQLVADRAQVSTILEQLTTFGILASEKESICSECETLNTSTRTECSLCGRPLDSATVT